MKAAGTKQRHVERCKYAAKPSAERKTRLFNKFQQTYKKRGDIVIVTPFVKSFIAPRNGWY